MEKPMKPKNISATSVIEGATTVLFVGMVAIATLQIICRYILQVSVVWSEELSRYLFMWVSLLGAAIAFIRGSHMSIGSLVTRLPERLARKVETVTTVIVAAFALLLLYHGIVLLGMKDYSFTMGFRMAWVHAAVPAAALIIVWSQLRLIISQRLWHSAWISAGAVLLASTVLVLMGDYVSVPPIVSVMTLVGLIVILVAFNMPIAIAVGVGCVVYLLLSQKVPLALLPVTIIGGMDSFVLLAVPLFILVGELMNTGGITERLVTFARALVGHIRGSLGISTIVGEYIFSGISGSSVADVSAMGSLLIPAMKRAGYRPELAVSIVTSASAMGMLVPPCIPMIVLASLTNLSVAALFVAGFLPAACISVLLIGLVYVQARREGIPLEKRQSVAQLLQAFRRAILPLFAPVIILGGILGGMVTATEGAVVGVLYALFLGMGVYREIHLRDLPTILINTACLTGMCVLMMGTASLLSWIFATVGVPGMLANAMLKLSSGSTPFLLATILVFLLLSAVLEGLPALIILTPILFPVAGHFSVVPLHFGIVAITAMGMGLFQPPMGVGFLIATALGKVRVEEATRAYMPYFAALVIGVLIVAFVPWLTLVIPRITNLL
jgi:tripartite ATP-independent transporter DctM subunit